jgi:hypothetical protein
MAKLISIYWRDIPAQVIGRVGRTNTKRELDPRFQQAIDRAAMRARKTSADAYLADWRRESVDVEGDIEQIVADRVAELERAFPHEYLEKVIRAAGLIADVQ